MDEQVEVRVSDKEWDPDWDAFVASTHFGHHVQTSLWGQVRASLGYHAMRYLVFDQGHIVAGAQLLIRRLFPFGAIGYIPKGPIYSIDNPALFDALLNKINAAIKNYHIQLLAIQPAYECPDLAELFKQHKFHPSWLELAPTATILLDLTPQTDQILSQMKRQTRQNIRRSEREGITVREGSQADLSTFYSLHLATCQRQEYSPYSEQYFNCMWQILAPHGYISLMMAEFGDEPVSALLLIPFGDTVIAKTLGWSGQYAEKRPNDAVFWASIQWSKIHGYRYYDFEGIDRRGAEIMVSGQPLPEELQHTPDFIKLGYGGQVSLIPKAYDLIPNPLFRWPYRIFFEKTDRGLRVNKLIDRFRRRIG